MSLCFAQRTQTVHRSFIREILKVTERPEVISFAGGLPNPALFPVQGMREASDRVLASDGGCALQYSASEGFGPLRQYIADRYRKRQGLEIDPEQILITTGSQQCLDLLGKVFLDQGSKVVLERPGYLGAIQAFSVFEPQFATIGLREDGPDLAELEKALDDGARMFYAVPNFQNPSGLTYGLAAREKVAEIMDGRSAVFVEDDPYGELRFSGTSHPPIKSFGGDNCILLGSFSKVTVPGFRIGWMVASPQIRAKAVTMKQAADLHTSTITQRTLYDYLTNNDLDAHVERIRECYGTQCQAMLESIARHFPKEVMHTKPEGGMFLWVALPEGCSSMDLFELAVEKNVAFVPGRPFHVEPGTGENTLRLNFSNCAPDRIEEGIKRLAEAIGQLLAS